TSRPKAGAEVVFVCNGNVAFSIAEDDRRYRLQIQDGEVALYTDEGDHIHFKRGKIIEIKAQTKLTIDSPLTELTGALKAAGNVEDAAGTMAAMRTKYNQHIHSDPVSGTTGLPQPTM
ncbi:MAG TPA: hypothetical protein PLL10_10165, partial [Elusimicrobiales bacterium]|nr:hypothetical protein [Elusimicrobiales bacterium]